MMYGPWDGGWGFGMMFVSLLFIALIVVRIVLVVRSFSQGGQAAPRLGGRRRERAAALVSEGRVRE